MSDLVRVSGRATWLLGRAHARAHRLLVDAFAAAGVRGYHYRLLAALEQYGPTSQAELGRRADVDRSDVVATLNDLVSRGFARREPDPADGRRNIVTITTAGIRTLVGLDALVDEVQEAVLAPLDVDERDAFLRLVTKLA